MTTFFGNLLRLGTSTKESKGASMSTDKNDLINIVYNESGGYTVIVDSSKYHFVPASSSESLKFEVRNDAQTDELILVLQDVVDLVKTEYMKREIAADFDKKLKKIEEKVDKNRHELDEHQA